MAPRTGCSMPSASTCRKRRAGLAAVLCAASLAAAVAGRPRPIAAQAVGTSGTVPPAASTFRSRTDLVALQVTVLDQHGRAVPNLQLDDFAVFEEGVRQPVALFGTSSAPLDVMLLLDTSGSMRERMSAAQGAAIELVQTLRPEDRASLILFSDSVRIAQPLTGNVGALVAAIRDASPAGGTALHEAVYIAMRELMRVRRADPDVRRQALVVLSDGEDTSSRNVSFQDLLDTARRSAVTVFTIMPAASVEIDPFERVTRGGPGAEFQMRNLARETGGQSFTPTRSQDLSATYRQIADELSQQYWLAYVSPPSTGGFKRVSVQIGAQPQLRVRTRSGYYATAARAGTPAVPGRREDRP
jgi:Ca-activated chloride channel homolog